MSHCRMGSNWLVMGETVRRMVSNTVLLLDGLAWVGSACHNQIRMMDGLY